MLSTSQLCLSCLFVCLSQRNSLGISNVIEWRMDLMILLMVKQYVGSGGKLEIETEYFVFYLHKNPFATFITE
jgi:hypothetical protein